VTLPATPVTGAQVVVADAGSSWGTNNLTVGRNGSTIGGLAENLVCDITGASVQFVYDGTTWEVYAQIGGQGGTVVTLDGTQTLTNKTFGNSTTFSAGTVSAPAITTSGDTNTGIFFPAADTIAFAEGGVESARIDASGNFGLGVVPSAWASGNKFMDVNASASYGAFGSSDSMTLANAYWNGSNWIRKNANNAWRMVMESASGAPSWTFQYAGNSTAGSTISWSEAMRIDSSGNVGIGTSSPTTRLAVAGGRTTLAANGEIYALGVQFSSSTGPYYIGATNSATPDLVFSQVGGSERMRLTNAGDLLVGATAQLSDEKFRVSSATTAGIFSNTTAASTRPVIYTLHAGSSGGTSKNHFEFLNSGGGTVGSIACTGTATSFVTSSDYRLKHDIQPMTGALAKVAQLKPVTYKWNSDNSDSQGFIAHELQEVVPDAVTGAKDAVDAEGKPVYQGIDTSFLVATLTAAIQEQQAMIEQLKADVAALKGA
jgi:hypothetical protein